MFYILSTMENALAYLDDKVNYYCLEFYSSDPQDNITQNENTLDYDTQP